MSFQYSQPTDTVRLEDFEYFSVSQCHKCKSIYMSLLWFIPVLGMWVCDKCKGKDRWVIWGIQKFKEMINYET